MVQTGFQGLIRTLRTTKNFWTALNLKNSNVKKEIRFRNGITLELSWFEFFNIRNILLLGGSVERIGEGLFRICKDKATFLVSSEGLLPVDEILSGIYQCDCFGKTVLDIGGFQGESAVYFTSSGPKRLIIYEPVEQHQYLIRQNMQANNFTNFQLYGEGIGKEDGMQTISYENVDCGFGSFSTGKKLMNIKLKNICSVIKDSNADIAKIDCEGAEDSLIDVPADIIRLIEYYMIEVHTPDIKNRVLEKFYKCSFKQVKENRISKEVSVLYFKRI